MKLCYLVGAMGGELCPELTLDDCLIAVDGGYRQVKEWGLSPHHVVGDFDSLGYTPTGENILPLPTEKDHTDMGVGLQLGRDLGYTAFLIQGGLGGRLDHTLGNLQHLLSLSRQGCSSLLLGEGQNVTVLTDSTLIFPPDLSGYCSIFALGGKATGVTLENLAYTLEDATLRPDFPLGVSNEFLPDKSAQITVKQGSLGVLWQGTHPLSRYQKILQGIKPVCHEQ